MGSLRSAFAARVYGPRGPLWLGALALLIGLPALRLPFEMDDHWLRLNYVREAPTDLMGGIDPSQVAMRKVEGSLAWWTHDGLRVRFLRPLTSLTHYADLHLYGEHPMPMHALNVLLYALLVVIAAQTYRALARFANEPPASVGASIIAPSLAALMFALDDAHASSTGWISGRNTLLAALFAVASLHAFVRGREGSLPARVLSPLLLALALLSGESGLQGAAYVIAFALVLDRAPLVARLRSFVPHVLMIAAWAVYYVQHRFGAHGSDWYREPWHEPLQSALAAIGDFPLWLGSALTFSFATPSLFADPTLARVAWSVLLTLVAPPLVNALRRSALARFYACGFLMCLLPLLLTRPQDRLLLCASFGAFGWLGLALSNDARDALDRYSRAVATALRGVHLGLAPLLFVAMLGQAEPIERSSRALSDLLSRHANATDVVVVNLPMEPLLHYARAQLQAMDAPLPQSTPLLYAGNSELRITRLDARTLEISAERGWLAQPFERLFATLGDGNAYRVAQRAWVGHLRFEIMEVNALGAPQRVRFEFASGLGDPQLVFIQWKGRNPELWSPPELGQTVVLPALPALSSLKER